MSSVLSQSDKSNMTVHTGPETPIKYTLLSGTESESTPSTVDGASPETQTKDSAYLANVYHEAALQKMSEGSFNEAVSFLKKALEISKKTSVVVGDSESGSASDSDHLKQESLESQTESSETINNDITELSENTKLISQPQASEVLNSQTQKDKITPPPQITVRDIGQTAFILGMAQLTQLNDPKSAAETLEYALELRQKTLGVMDPGTLITQSALATSLQRIGECEKALRLIEKQLDRLISISQTQTSSSSSDSDSSDMSLTSDKVTESNNVIRIDTDQPIAMSYTQKATCLEIMERWEEALECYKKALAIYEKQGAVEDVYRTVLKLILLLQQQHHNNSDESADSEKASDSSSSSDYLNSLITVYGSEESIRTKLRDLAEAHQKAQMEMMAKITSTDGSDVTGSGRGRTQQIPLQQQMR